MMASHISHMALDIESVIPELLQEVSQWITWVAGPADPNGKFDKYPKGKDGTGTAWQTSAQWMTFSEALRAARNQGHSGVGLVLPAKTQYGMHVVALDFDDVALDTSDSPRLAEIQQLQEELGNPYIEKSPSGKGLRLFVLSEDSVEQISSLNPLGGKDELFCSSGRWTTVTGKRVGGSSVPDATIIVKKLASQWRARRPAVAAKKNRARTPAAPVAMLGHLTQGWQGWPTHRLQDGDGREQMMLSYAGHLRSQGIAQEEIERLCLVANQDHYQDKLDDEVVLDRARRYETHSSNGGHGSLLDSHGDIRNGRAFASIHRDKFLYVTTRDRWLQWRNDLWALCEKEEHVAEAKVVCGQILSAAAQIFGNDQQRGKKLLQDAMAAHNLPRVIAMLKLAVSEPGMATTDRELDSDPYLLGVSNGVVNLKNGMLQINQPELKVTRYCNAAHVEHPSCPRWLAFLDEVFLSDVKTIESVQTLLGYTLVGTATEEKLIICYGHGSNGKSVFSNVVQKIVGGMRSRRHRHS